MLKKSEKGQAYFSDLPAIYDNEKVNPITQTINAPDPASGELSRRELAERNTRALDKNFAAVEKMIDRFLVSSEPLDWARVNDTALRIAARFSDRKNSDSGSLKTFYTKLISTAGRSMALRREGVCDLDAERLTATSQELVRRLEGLESSITQLLSVIDTRQRLSPESGFATSVDLDVRYGIDLIEAVPHFVGKRDALEIDINLYQCKASRTGLADDEIRKLARQYRERAKLATGGEHLLIDPDFFERELKALERQVEVPQLTEDELLEGIVSEGEAFRDLLAKSQHADARSRFIAQRKLHQYVEGFAQKLGEKNPISAPEIKLGRIEMLFGVDTRRGLQILNIGEAENFGLPESKNRPNAATSNSLTLAK